MTSEFSVTAQTIGSSWYSSINLSVSKETNLETDRAQQRALQIIQHLVPSSNPSYLQVEPTFGNMGNGPNPMFAQQAMMRAVQQALKIRPVISKDLGRFGKVIDIQAPGIGGVRYDATGEFIGFLEP